MSPLHMPPHLTFANAIFLYKTTNEAEWTTLPCSEDHSKYNCCGIRFDGFGVCVTQRNTEHESVCHLKLILKSPAITAENDQLTVEAACVGIRSLDLVPNRSGTDSAHALEHSKTLPLALIGDTIIAVTLYDLTGTREGTKMLEQQKLIQLIPSLIEQGFQAWSARHINGFSGSTTQPEIPNITVSLPGQTKTPGTQHTNGSSESTTQPGIPDATVSNPGQTVTPSTQHTNGSSASTTQPAIPNATVSNSSQTVTPRTIIPRTRQPRRLYNPNAHPYSPSSPSAGSPGTEQLARKPTLEQRMKAHQIEVTTTELRLRQRLEDDRHTMLRAVTRPITEAVNREFDRIVDEALKEHRARAEIITGKIVAEDG